MKKLTTISSIFALMAVPAVAAPMHTSATFPQSGVMEEDYQYTGQANVTNLKVASGTANTLAGYTDCPSGYPNSDAGATSTDECYKACTVADLPANSHAATASGKNYSGANVTDTCAIASCNEGYTLTTTPDLVTIVGETAGTGGGIDNSGNWYEAHPYNGTVTKTTFGISANNTWGVDYGSGKGYITGKAVCSTQSGTNNWDGNATTSDNVTATFGTGINCWCKIDSYTPDGGTKQSLSASWMFAEEYPDDGHGHGGPSYCSSSCAVSCADKFERTDSLAAWRIAVFNSVEQTPPSCTANVITINWDHADAADITANDAGSVTYGGNINTPKKAQHINGKIFTGWTFVTPNQ